MGLPYICGQGVTIDFPIFENAQRSFKNSMLHATTGGCLAQSIGNSSVVRAVDNVSFVFDHGDRVGLVGHNGSGKTTLLRALSGVYEPTAGTIEVQGHIASLLDVSTGIDSDATGYENIYLRAIMMGLQPQEARKRIEEIADFSELGNYLNLPVRTYSSGMMLRLAFSISTSVSADILLMDEWLSVGDSSFTTKATERLNALVDNSSVLVIASHDEHLLSKLCNRIIRLEHGKIVEEINEKDRLLTQ